MNKRRSRRGFTLLEMLIVVVIIGILSVIALPNFGKFVKRAKAVEAKNLVSSLLGAEFIYYQEKQRFTNVQSELGMDPPVSPRFTFAASGASTTGVRIVATGTGDAAGVNVTGTVSDTGIRTITSNVD